MQTRSKLAVLVALGSGVALMIACATQGASDPSASPAATSTATPAGSTAPTSTTPAPTPTVDAAVPPARRYKEIKGVLHVHSAYSHDASMATVSTAASPTRNASLTSAPRRATSGSTS